MVLLSRHLARIRGITANKNCAFAFDVLKETASSKRNATGAIRSHWRDAISATMDSHRTPRISGCLRTGRKGKAGRAQSRRAVSSSVLLLLIAERRKQSRGVPSRRPLSVALYAVCADRARIESVRKLHVSAARRPRAIRRKLWRLQLHAAEEHRANSMWATVA